MDGPITGATVFACLFTAAVAGVLVHARLPGRMLPQGTGDVVRRGVGMVAAMAALLVAMMTVSLKTSFDSADRDVKRFSAQLIELDRTLRRAGPDAAPARELLFRYTARAMKDIWPESRVRVDVTDKAATPLLDRLEDAVVTLRTTDPERQMLVAEARRILQDITESRWAMEAHSGGSLSPWLIAVVGFWLVLTFGTFGLSAPLGGIGSNTVVISSLFLCAVAVGGVMFLLQEYDYPFRGIIMVSHEPLQNALFVMGE